MSPPGPRVERTSWQRSPALRLQDTRGASAVLALHGGHLLSWCSPAGQEQLFLSTRTRIGEGQAVRGGVPVIFPRFAQREGFAASVPRHGFARTRVWAVVEAAPPSTEGDPADGPDAAVACLRLIDDSETRALWPHRFELSLTVRLCGPRLTLELAVRNTDDVAWPFQAALHTYLAVASVVGARLDGLASTGFVDSTGGQTHGPSGAPLVFDGAEIDRLYLGGAAPLTLDDGRRRLGIEASGLPDVVVWNPGAVKAAKLDDLAAGDAGRFVCVEAAAIEPMRELQPGQRWRGAQHLTVVG